jgi:uncharacterized linocin/CFP29 family protein
LSSLEKSVKELVLFEENAIYKGLEDGNIKGLLNDATQEVIKISKEPSQIMDAITEGMLKLKEAYADTPYSLVVGKEVLKILNRHVDGTSLLKRLEDGNIKGLLNDATQEVIKISKEPSQIMDAITEGMLKLKEAYADTPYSLVVGKEVLKILNRHVDGTSLLKRIEDLLGSKVIYSHVLEGALLLPYDHEDLELTIGQDFTIGYQSHDNDKVKFYVTESFTYRTLDENIIIKLTL